MQRFCLSHVLKALILFVLMSIALPVYAVKVEGLYEAMVPVASQNAALRKIALRDVLRAVVVKVSGKTDLPTYFDDQGLSVEHMVEQFGYNTKMLDGERQMHLWARLNPQLVRQVIRDQGLPIWPVERPVTLVWLAIEDNENRQILAEGSQHDVLSQLQLEAERRGLPLTLPVMDLSESAVVDYLQVASLDAQALQEVSERYASQYLLIGHLQHYGDGQWSARWSMNGSPIVTQLPQQAILQDAIRSGIDPLATTIAEQFSSFSRSDNPQYLDVIVDDIASPADYARSLKYLRSLSLINRVDVVRLSPQGMHFRLHTRADIAAVLQVIGIGRVLYARDTIDQLIFGLNP